MEGGTSSSKKSHRLAHITANVVEVSTEMSNVDLL